MTFNSDNYIEYELEISRREASPVRVLQDATGASRCGVGSTIWDAGLVMAKYLDHQTQSGNLDLSGKTVLELGSGTGIVGITLAKLQPNCTVVLTDKPELVALLKHNIEMNTCKNAAAEELDWCDDGERQLNGRWSESRPDVILVSDGIWASELHKPLADTLARLAGEHTRVVIGYETRRFDEEAKFVALWSQAFRFRDIKPDEQHPVMQSEDIYIFEGTRK
ncbi:Protein-lysine N-methyltransferase efm6 [Coemansia interrupta]|uniref:Protein-lysine N-methyltransferase efm6 n=1 Tax=Coemansia interrupta TaxID=1126814 RepID=A0A9W8H0R0_9FUNG|nr:Protein-lysine N-methyltransferase efm6 [Coemansia interrupta]